MIAARTTGGGGAKWKSAAIAPSRNAGACASERQNFRVALVDYLGMQPGKDPDANMTTANNAIALAQKDIVTAFARRKAAAK